MSGKTGNRASSRIDLRLLLSCLVALVVPCACVAADVVVDNDGGAPGYAETGTWITSGSPGFQGGTYRYVNGVSGPPTCSATWTANLPASANYRVYAAFRDGSNRTTSAPVTITHKAGITPVALNQQGTAGVVERFLGEFSFDAGIAASVRMDNNGTTAVHIADAMIWRVVADPPPSISAITRDQEVPTQAAPVVVTATVTDNVAVASVSVSYSVTPSGVTGAAPALDDGNHGDGAAGDHVYGATIPAQPNGSVVAYYFTAVDNLAQSAASRVHYYGVGPLPPTVADVVVDNDNGTPGYVETGGWTTSASTGFEGGTYRYITGVSGAPTGTATWTPSLPCSGVYRVYAALLQGTNRTTSAPMTITHAAGQVVVPLNQYGGGVSEILLGEYPFDAGTSGSVRMDNNGAAGIYVADAMIWRLPSDPPPKVSLVTRSPAVPGSSEPVTVTATVTDNFAVTSAALCYKVGAAAVFTVVQAWDDGAHGDGAAGDHVYGAVIPPQPNGSTVSLYYTAWDNLGQSAVSPSQYYVVGQEPRHVYVVLSSDTSVWGVTGGYYGVVNWNVFESRTGVMSRVYDSDFRNACVDSLGRPFKVTWFMHGGAWFTPAVNSTPISALYHIRKNWGDGITAWGDALEYHFHHYVWDGTAWIMAPTFAERIWEYEWVMSQMMLEEHLFVTAFRSGWNYMDDIYQQYLERWLPFRMEGVQSGWVPYHPSFSNWRLPGTMKGWEARHMYMKSFTASTANQAFNAARLGTDQVLCIWSHQNEADYPEQIAAVDAALHAAAAGYPSVQFHYCSAKEAMQKWLGHTPTAPPPLEVTPAIAGDNVSVTVHTADDIYQEQPWVAARRYTGECVRLNSWKAGPGLWRFSYSRGEFDHVAVGVSDLYGTDAIAEVDDGSRRWAVQSEFAGASPWQVDHDTSPTCAMLAKKAGVYVTSGTLTFDHSMEAGGQWRSVRLEGNAPAGTALRWRYKSAGTRQLLDDAPWSPYEAGLFLALPSGLQQPWIRVEVLLEGTGTLTPSLNSVEVAYDKAPTAVDPDDWKLY
jgi:hypothetical protein